VFWRRLIGGARRAVEDPRQLKLWSGRDGAPDWNVRISRRARRMSIRVFPGGRVEIVVPPGVGVPQIERFVAQHRAWAERRSGELLLLNPQGADRRPAQVTVGLLDRTWDVEYRIGSRTRVQNQGEPLLLVTVPTLSDAHVSNALRRWLRTVAQQELGERLAAVGSEIGIDYRQLQLRRQRTRWGSCTTVGNINLNVCLMFQPPAVVRYLMIHELCHRRHMNHSRRFWSLVESFEPGWRELDAQLLKGWRHVPAWVFS